MTYNSVIIRKIKRPEGIGRWPVYEISKDSHGLWLFSPQGTIYRGQAGADVGECEVGQGNRQEGMPVLHLIPNTAWWIAAWCPDYISLDICTPPRFIDGEWCYTDLELDLTAYSDGRVEIEDEDEFVAACDAGLIPHEEEIQARIATEEMARCLQNRTEPFGHVGWDRLDEVQGLSLSPIRVLPHI